MSKNIAIITSKLAGYLLQGIIVIIPLFFLSLSTSRLGMDFFNKEYLLWMTVPLIFFLGLFPLIKQNQVYFWRAQFNKYVLVYLGLLCLSVLFSRDMFASLFGAFGSATQPLVSIATLLLFFYLVISYAQERSHLLQIARLALTTYIVTVLIAVMLLLGYFGNNQLITGYFTYAVGNLEDLALYLAVLNVFIFAIINNKLLLVEVFANRKSQWLLRIAFAFSIFLLTLINYYLSWLVLLVGLLAILWFQRVKKNLAHHEKLTWKIRTKNNLWTIAVLSLSLIFLINHFSYGGVYQEGARFYQKFQLDNANSRQIAVNALKQDPLLGSGPETYAYQFSLYRSSDFNDSQYWALRFNQGSSFMLELLTTTGILPALAYLSMLAYLLGFGFVRILRLKNDAGQSELAGVLLIGAWATVLVLVLVQFLFPANIVQRFLLWLFAAIMMAGLHQATDRAVFEKVSVKSKGRGQKMLMPFAALLFFVWVLGAAYEFKYWLADISYAQAVSARDADEREQGLQQALDLNKHRGSYYASLSKHYLGLARLGMQRAAGERDLDTINQNINKSINIAQQGLAVDPDNVVLYETLGMIYRSMSGLSGDTGALAKQAFASASELEPTNPVLMTELAKAMLASQDLDEAIKTLERAIELKADYYDAHFNLAKAFIQKNNNAQALEILDSIEGEISNPEFFYERGRANHNQKNYETAIRDFRVVLNNMPLHSNALYSLAVSLEQSGQSAEALSYYQKALQVNPSNELLQAKVDELGG